MAEIIVGELDVMTEATWSFGSPNPTWRHRTFGSSGVFDPFPGYRHDVDVVRDTAVLVQQVCPPLWDVELFVADREELGRSNGYSNVHHDDNGEWVKDPPVGLIMLSGKRIPPHPALTAYLVAHEYGHNIQWMLAHLRHSAEHLQSDRILQDYAELRGLPVPVHHGSGGRWHDSVGEVFACDFRIMVCGIEDGFWPHPGVPHPRAAGVQAWWDQAVDDLRRAAARKDTADA